MESLVHQVNRLDRKINEAAADLVGKVLQSEDALRALLAKQATRTTLGNDLKRLRAG